MQAASKAAEVVTSAPKPAELVKATAKKQEVVKAASKPAEAVKAAPKPAVAAKTPTPAEDAKAAPKTALSKAAELAKELDDDDDDDLSFPPKKVATTTTEPKQATAAPKPELKAAAKQESVKPHHVAKVVPVPQLPKSLVVKAAAPKHEEATKPSDAELKAEAKEKALEAEVAMLKKEVKAEADAAAAAKENARKAVAATSTTTTTSTTKAATTTTNPTTTSTTPKVEMKPKGNANATQTALVLPNMSTAPKLMKYLNLNSTKSALKVDNAPAAKDSIAIDDKPNAVLIPPVSMASFYDEQDQYNPLQQGPKSRTLDISGDKTAGMHNEMDQEKQPKSWWQSLISWWFPPKAAPKKVTSLLSETHKGDWDSWNSVGQSKTKQNASITALAALDDSQHTISIADSFGDLEKQDEEEEYKVEHEDNTQRAEAEQQIAVPKESPEVLKNRQVHISNIFSQLEEQDDQIQSALLSSDDMTAYSRLSKLQDASMDRMTKALEKAEKASAQAKAERPLLKHNDNAFEAKPIHDPWKALEAQ